MKASAIFGNIYAFEGVQANTPVKLEFDKPLKRVSYHSSGFRLCDDDGQYIAAATANHEYDFVSKNGLPNYLMLNASAAGTAIVMVEEFGVSANPEYWKVES